jgi:hypothetical protein
LTKGVKEDVAQQIHQAGELFRQHLAVEAGLLLAGEGVAVAPYLVDLPGYVQGGAPGGAFEGHVFQEVAETVF